VRDASAQQLLQWAEPSERERSDAHRRDDLAEQLGLAHGWSVTMTTAARSSDHPIDRRIDS
jgi:hypothetical protein